MSLWPLVAKFMQFNALKNMKQGVAVRARARVKSHPSLLVKGERVSKKFEFLLDELLLVG